MQTSPRSQTTPELLYRFRLSQNLVESPDLQVTINPSFANEHSSVYTVGLCLRLTIWRALELAFVLQMKPVGNSTIVRRLDVSGYHPASQTSIDGWRDRIVGLSWNQSTPQTPTKPMESLYRNQALNREPDFYS
jgi:hypothetical protein